MSKTPPPRRKSAPPARKPVSASGSNTEHSVLSPSYSKTWLTCAASLAMGVGVKDSAGAAAQNGTVMHYLSELCINHGKAISWHDDEANPHSYVGQKIMDTPYHRRKRLPECDIAVTKDMADAVREYIEFARKLHNSGAIVKIESRVSMTSALQLDDMRIETVNPDGETVESPVEAFGTGDLVALVDMGDDSYTLYVGDLKTGRNVVLAEGEAGSRSGNPQLMLYAGGLLPVWREKLAEINPQGVIRQVCLVIIAPYMGFQHGINTFSTTPDAVEIFMQHASERAKLALDCLARGKKGLKGGDFKPTEAGCKWCKAREICGAKNRAILADLKDMGPGEETIPAEVVVLGEPRQRKAPPPRRKAAPPRLAKPAAADAADAEEHELTPEEITAAYAKLPALRDHIKTIEAAMHRLMFVSTAKGDKVKGWKLVRASGGNRKWADETAVAELMKGARFRDDEIYDRKVRSPKQLEELVAEKPRVLNKLKALMTRPEDKPVIAAADDTRPEWVPATKTDLSFDD